MPEIHENHHHDDALENQPLKLFTKYNPPHPLFFTDQMNTFYMFRDNLSEKILSKYQNVFFKYGFSTNDLPIKARIDLLNNEFYNICDNENTSNNGDDKDNYQMNNSSFGCESNIRKKIIDNTIYKSNLNFSIPDFDPKNNDRNNKNGNEDIPVLNQNNDCKNSIQNNNSNTLINNSVEMNTNSTNYTLNTTSPRLNIDEIFCSTITPENKNINKLTTNNYNVKNTSMNDKEYKDTLLNDLLTLKKLYHFEKQSMIRSRIIQILSHSYQLDQFFTSCPNLNITESEDIFTLEKIEKEYNLNVEKERRNVHLNVCLNIPPQYSLFMKKRKILDDKLCFVYDLVRNIHYFYEKEDILRTEREEKDKILSLKNGDDKMFKKFIDESKKNKLNLIFDKTNEYLQQMCRNIGNRNNISNFDNEFIESNELDSKPANNDGVSENMEKLNDFPFKYGDEIKKNLNDENRSLVYDNFNAKIFDKSLQKDVILNNDTHKSNKSILNESLHKEDTEKNQESFNKEKEELLRIELFKYKHDNTESNNRGELIVDNENNDLTLNDSILSNNKNINSLEVSLNDNKTVPSEELMDNSICFDIDTVNLLKSNSDSKSLNFTNSNKNILNLNNITNIVSKDNEPLPFNVPNIKNISKFNENSIYRFKIPNKIKLKTAPKSLTYPLKDYQLKGIEWLSNFHYNNFNGILADEPGLGKAIQTIAFISYLTENYNITNPFLIITPSSKISKWTTEIKKYNSSLSFIEYKGSSEQRKITIPSLNKTISQNKCNFISNPKKNTQIVLVTPEYLTKDKQILSKLYYYYTIIDEDTKSKNKENHVIQTLLTSYKCKYRIFLTRISLKRNLNELWYIFNYILPDFFSSLHSFDEWLNGSLSIVGEKINLSDCEKMRISEKLYEILEMFTLKRMKNEVLKEVSGRKEEILWVEMSKLQRVVYDEMIKRIYGKYYEADIGEKDGFESKHIEKNNFEAVNGENKINENENENGMKESIRGLIFENTGEKEDFEKLHSEIDHKKEFFNSNQEKDSVNINKNDKINDVKCNNNNLKIEIKVNLEDINKNIKDATIEKHNEPSRKRVKFDLGENNESITADSRNKKENINKNAIISQKLTNSNIKINLKKICNHPFMFEQIERKINPLGTNNSFLYTLSGKFNLMNKILPKLKKTNRKVLMIFQMTGIMTIMEDYLAMKSYLYLKLDGNKRNEEKRQMIEKFNSDLKFFVLLASQRFNSSFNDFKEIDTVILFDGDLEINGIGNLFDTEKNISIFRLVTTNSIEECDIRYEKKKSNFNRIPIKNQVYKENNNDQKFDVKLSENNDHLNQVEKKEKKSGYDLNEKLARNKEELEIFRKMDNLNLFDEKYDDLDTQNDYRIGEIFSDFNEININEIKSGKNIEDTGFIFKKIVKPSTNENNLKKLEIFNKFIQFNEKIEIFMELPSKNRYPGYYRSIKNPISMTCIKKKLKNNNYRLNNLKKDMILLFSNAMTYNREGSQIYNDALFFTKIIDEMFKDI